MNSLLLLLAVAVAGAGSPGVDAALDRPVERVISIDVPNHDAVYALQRQFALTVVDADVRSVTAYADDRKIEQLRALGYSVTILAEDYRQLFRTGKAVYATYAEVCSTMRYLAIAYPAITRLETLGFSVLHRAILTMKVTASPDSAANKARIRLNGPHHGNEKIATEITLAFLKYLCENYATNPGVQALVNTREIWITPIFNVDGHIVNDRYNDNGVDLNRDYGYEWDGWGSSPSPGSQPETKAMYRQCERIVPALEYSYHSAASYVNYLWDNHPSDPPDSGWIIALSQRYCDSTYGSGTTQLDPINGYDWYEVHGSCQDQTFGCFGGLAWTVETQQPSSRSSVDLICVANRRALLDMIRLAGWGIQGLVHDSVTQAPLFARIEFTNPYRWITYSQAQVGDFHKMLPAGTYSLRVSANGYLPKTITNITVPDTGAVNLDVPLMPPGAEPLNYVQKVVNVQRIDDSHIYTDWVVRALGPSDGIYYTMGPSQSNVVFDVDPFRPVRNQPGNDIAVYATGPYQISAANNWEGPWFSLGNGNGNASFDLASVSLDSARYLKVVSNGSVLLDAISYVGLPGTVVSVPRIEQMVTQFRISPNPAVEQARIELALAGDVQVSLSIVDAVGRRVRTLAQGAGVSQQRSFVWNLRDNSDRPVSGGVYFCRLAIPSGLIVKKFVVER
jgi:hypothetical protein